YEYPYGAYEYDGKSPPNDWAKKGVPSKDRNPRFTGLMLRSIPVRKPIPGFVGMVGRTTGGISLMDCPGVVGRTTGGMLRIDGDDTFGRVPTPPRAPMPPRAPIPPRCAFAVAAIARTISRDIQSFIRDPSTF